MVIAFEIMSVTDIHERGQFIFARLIDSGVNFDLSNEAVLGDIPIHSYLEIPRLLDKNKQPRLDVFIFRQINAIQGQQRINLH